MPELLRSWAHLAVLWSFAFAKPLFDILGDSPEFFVARENTSGDIILLAFAVTLVPPTLLILVEALFVRVPRARLSVHLLFVGLLVTAIALEVLEDLSGINGAVLIPVSLALGAAGALLYARGRVLQATLGVLTPLPLLFVALFLLFSPVSDLVLPQDTSASAGGTGEGKAVPVVVVVFDELPAVSLMDSRQRIDRRRYPNFARLADDATWYRNATTAADFSTEAVPAILTGRRPGNGQLPIASDHPDNLFTLLGRRYRFNVHEPITDLCPTELCEERAGGSASRLRDLVSDLTIVSLHRLLPADLGDGLPAVDLAFSGFGAAPTDHGVSVAGAIERERDQRLESFEDFVRAVDDKGERPPLHFIHSDFPHAPWDRLPSGQRYPGEGVPGLRGDEWTGGERLLLQAHQRHLLQVGYVDRLLGRLLDRIRSTGLYERSLIVVTSDHGGAFRSGAPRRAVSEETFADVAGVPLLIKAPAQQRARIDDTPASSIDILPTIADYLGLDPSWSTEGRSLRGDGSPPRDSITVFAKEGATLTQPFSEFVQRRDDAIERNTRLFGSSEGRKGLFAIGGGSSLIGVPVKELERGAPTGARAVLDNPSAYASIPRGVRVLPVFMTGRVVGELPPQLPLAVAVNGRVAAVTPGFVASGTRLFEVIFDPAQLRPGANEIRIFAVREAGTTARLAPLVESETYKLVQQRGSELIVSSAGRRTRVLKATRGGFVDKVARSGAVVSLSGWSATQQAGPAENVLAFSEGRFVGSGQPLYARPDIAAAFGPSTRTSGFALSLRFPGRREAQAKIRVFGLLDGAAVELFRAPGS